MKKLKDVLKIKNGKDYKAFDAGNIPVYGTGGIITHINTAAYSEPSVLIPRKGSLEKLYFVEQPFWTVDTIFYTEIDTTQALPKFVYYYLESLHLERMNKAGGIPSLTQTQLNKIKFPEISILKQEEIVSILDTFTDLIDTLKNELALREKQLKYYRSNIFKKPKWEVVKLTDVAQVLYGSDEYKHLNFGLVPVYGSGGIITYVDKPIYSKASILIPRVGSTENLFFIDEPFWTINTIFYTNVDTTRVLPRFLFYALQESNLIKAQNKAGVPNRSIKKLKNIKVKIPNSDIQEKIVKFLGTLESLIQSLREEIELRQKQYKYYRDKLLDFNEETE